jgi:biopolymer transport protein ExbB
LDIAELFERGGLLMWPIVACSVLAMMAFIERLIALRRSEIAPKALLQSLTRHLDAGDAERALHVCRESPSALATVAEAGLLKRGRGRDAAKEAMEEAGSIAVGRMERWIAILATVAAIAPLLGLLGTVTGMIEVFNDIEGATDPNVSLLANGIKKALYTTAAGLTVAIPVFVGYRFLTSRIDQYATELEENGLSLLDKMVPEEGSLLKASRAATPDVGDA